jgi:hypothetical protein
MEMLRRPSWPASAVKCSARHVGSVDAACVLAAAVLVFALKLGVAAAALTGPPDGRVYEQVSAAKKNGNEAGVALGTVGGQLTTLGSYADSAPGGGAVAYYQEGPAGETASGADLFSVSKRNSLSGWETSAVQPPEDLSNGDFLGAKPLTLLPAADLSRFLFVAQGPFVKENSLSTGPLKANENEGLYRTRGNSSEPEWLTRPTAVSQGMGEVTEGSKNVKNVHSLSGGIKSVLELPVGAKVVGQKIPVGTTISKVSTTEIELTNAVEGTGATTVNETLEVSIAKPATGRIKFGLEGIYPVGGSPDLSTVYFTYFGTLVAADESRAPHVEPLTHLRWSQTETYGGGEVVEEENGKEFRSCGPDEEEPPHENVGHQPAATFGACYDSEGKRKSGVWWEEITPTTGIFGPWGFYEWQNGELRSAGELPDGTYSPYGAVPAVTENRTGGALKFPFARFLGNEVSQDGSKAFFISPQNLGRPQPQELRANEPDSPTELYVREQTAGGPKTVLVSRDELEAGSPKPPAPAPACKKGESFEVCAETAVTPVKTQGAPEAYVYASPDGSRAFFESKDKLAKSAVGNLPEGAGPWTYEFNVAEEKVTYLPGVIGPIAASSHDGSSFIFKNTATHKIELWSGGTSGHAEEIASFSTPPEAQLQFEGVATKNGAVFVFNTNAAVKRAGVHNKDELEGEVSENSTIVKGLSSTTGIVVGDEVSGAKIKPGTFVKKVITTKEVELSSPIEGAGSVTATEMLTFTVELMQAYRYEVNSKTLSCVSCAPKAVAQHSIEDGNGQRGQGREIADEGRRVFFATATKLVPAAQNGVEDVYEWEQAGTGSCQSEEREGGCLYLVSSGTSPHPSFYLDNDESGENVFFATEAQLVKSDTDESYDVYDARVGGGFPEPQLPTECAGTCRSAGPGPSLSAPISATIGSAENSTRVETSGVQSAHSTKPTGKPLTRAQKLVKALKACTKKPKRKRAACIQQAKKLYGANAKTKSTRGSARRRG